MGKDYKLVDILDIPKWEKLQDSLAKITGTAIITIDYKGTPVTKHSARTEFCSIIRENPISRKRCFKCDALAGIEAVRLDRPYIYLCHCGIVDVACPITVGDKYLGAVMFGQVRIPDGDPEGKVTRLISEISSFQPNSEQTEHNLQNLYNLLPELEYERIEELATLIATLIEYLVTRAVENKANYVAYEHMIRNIITPLNGTPDLNVLSSPEEIVPISEISKAKTNNSPLPVKLSSPVYPAVTYIESHLSQKITLADMADLCGLSTSYFSRLFTHDVGENFKDYVNRRKVELAKELLLNKDSSVSNVCDSLGYMDVSNFVKIFKRYEGITPAKYKQQKDK